MIDEIWIARAAEAGACDDALTWLWERPRSIDDLCAEHPQRGPQHEWEPPRTVAGPPRRGRPTRLRQLGNAVVPRQAAVALSRLLTMAHDAETPAQGRLL